MGISFGGIVSGLPANLVEQIIQAERKPLELVEKNKANQENKLKLLGELKANVLGLNNTLSTLASFSALREIAARSTDESILTVSADKERAKPGIYTLKVEKMAKNASAISCGFPDKDYTELGIGYLVFDMEGEEKEIFIGEDNNTLEGMAATINGSGLPVRASVVHDEAAEDEDEQFRIIIATEQEGADQHFNFPNFYFMDGDVDFYFENESEPHNGQIIIDGFPLTIKSNKLTEIVPGATINLLEANPRKNVSIIIEEDVESVAGKVESFVENVNKVLDFFESQFAIKDTTDTSKTLGGDTSLQGLQYRIRMILQNEVPGVEGNYKRLSDLGITFTRAGRLEFNKKQFLAAANEDFKAVSDVFSSNRTIEDEDGEMIKQEGVVTKLYNTFRSILFGDGILSIKDQALRGKIKALDRQIEGQERRLEQRKKALRSKFARLETNMAKMKAQTAQMNQAMGGIANSMSGPGLLAGKIAGPVG